MSLTTSVSDPLVGHVLGGRYEILSRLARGGMAKVYKAADRRLGRIVAVKVMHEGLGDDTDFAAKFEREARSAAKLQHPNVVAVFDQGQDMGRPYIVMEYVEGRTLRSVISQEAPLPPARALEYLEPIVRALAAAHEAGIVHRDVKPENVLISEHGQVKVADFGLARAITGQTATATEGLLIGTVSYIPPELVTNGRATSRSDVYSTGVVLYEMLTGKKPHTGETPIQVAYSHVHNDVPAPSLAAPRPKSPRDAIPGYVDALVRACTARDPNLRPRDGRVLQQRVTKARNALARGITDDPALTASLGSAEDTARLPGPTPGSPSSPATPRTPRTPRTPTEPSVWTPRPKPLASGIRLHAVTPASLADVRPEGALPLAEPHRSAARVRPLVQVSQRRVHRQRRGMAMLVLLLIVGLGLGGSGYWWMSSGRYTTAPALTNLTESEATASAQNAKLGIAFTKEYSETVPAGRIIRATPSSGDQILRTGTIAGYLSSGPERYDVPKLIGLTTDAAAAALAAVNLKLGRSSEVYDEVAAPGTIIAATLAPGSKQKRGTPVDVTLSKGPAPIPITSFVGKPATDAAAALKAAGLTVTMTAENSATAGIGLVISQSPSEGNGKLGDAVALVSSKGPVMVTIPDVRGKNRDQAVKQLKDLGFAVTTKNLVGSGIAFGLASYTEPAAGQAVPEGSAVSVLLV